MQVLFIYPAKAYLLPKPNVQYRGLNIEGSDYIVFDNQNLYADSKTNKIRYETSEGSNSYFLWITADIYARVGSADSDERMIARIKNLPADIVLNTINQAKEILSDIPAYECKKAKVLEEKRERSKLDDIKRAELRKQQEEKDAIRLEEEDHNSACKFINGDMIAFSVFERLCDKNNIKMPIQTLGAARKNVVEIALGKMRIRNNSQPKGVYIAAKELMEKLTAH